MNNDPTVLKVERTLFQNGKALFREHYLKLAIFFVILLITGLVFFIFRHRLEQLEQPQELAKYGYAGVFILSLVTSAGIVIPLPGPLAVFIGGWLLNPVLVALVAGIAESIGELTGYSAGYAGRGIFNNNVIYDKMKGWMKRHGSLTIFILSAVPNPVFDLAGIAAGALHFPLWKFFLSCWTGKTLKSLYIALLGYWGVEWVHGLLKGLF